MPGGLTKIKIDFTSVADRPIKEIFGKSCSGMELAKKTWAFIKKHDLRKQTA